MNFALRLYRRLAQAFPHEFKLAYGTDCQLGEDVIGTLPKGTASLGLIRLIVDIAIRVPLEYLSEMRGDLRYATRALRKSPGFALVGIVSMGLGIGLTTNVYSSKVALISRDLPTAANARALVMPDKPNSYYYIEQYRRKKPIRRCRGISERCPFQCHLAGRRERETRSRVRATGVSGLFFSARRSAEAGKSLQRGTGQARRGPGCGDQRPFLAQSPKLITRRGGDC